VGRMSMDVVAAMLALVATYAFCAVPAKKFRGPKKYQGRWNTGPVLGLTLLRVSECCGTQHC
jgi:hypothetical protein